MIPRKLFDRLCTSLTYARIEPGPATDAVLLADETECRWPFAASQEQADEWAAICERTRATFEERVTVLRGNA